MRLACVGLAAVLGLAALSPAHAQTCSGTAVKGAATPASAVFTPPVVVDFDAGHVDYIASLTLTENLGNKTPWTLCVRVNTATMGVSTQGTYTKPVSDLQIKESGQPDAAFRSVTQTEQVIATYTGKTGVSLDIRILLAWTSDEPGTYGTNLILTAYK